MNAASAPESTGVSADLYAVLEERGLIAQCTDEKIVDRLAAPVTCYCGFDPTADSLHIGNFVPIMLLAHAQRCGHRPLVLVGGATGLVGDPSGKSEARNMLDVETVRRNAEAITRQLGRVLRFDDSSNGAVMVNNLDWIAPLSWLEVLREVGGRVSVNRMLSMESVKQRMDGDGISYLEFSYMLLQAYDFAHLFKSYGCTLQLSGQDQWGNIVMGIELGRKLHGADLAGLTAPLITKADGGKFGKTESGTVWLDAARTPVFDFFQFWRNVDDRDVGRFLRQFTFLPIAEIEPLESAGGAGINEAKVRLAYEITKLVHGEEQAEKAKQAAAGAFASGGGGVDVTGDGVPSAALPADELAAGVGVIELMKRAGFAASNGEARRLIQGGGVRIGDTKVADLAAAVTPDDAADGFVL
ncbi:MAG: tyrosine--tRNA ligase, partial [Planctomycetota bacterium]